jgi:hypothetical protein
VVIVGGRRSLGGLEDPGFRLLPDVSSQGVTGGVFNPGVSDVFVRRMP